MSFSGERVMKRPHYFAMTRSLKALSHLNLISHEELTSIVSVLCYLLARLLTKTTEEH